MQIQINNANTINYPSNEYSTTFGTKILSLSKNKLLQLESSFFWYYLGGLELLNIPEKTLLNEDHQ